MINVQDLVVVRENGLYCPSGDFYIDPHRPVARALITHGHSDHARAGSQTYIAERSGLSILRHRLGDDAHARLQGVAYGETLFLGETRVSFHPAGHVLGSAQIRIEHEGQVTVVSGDYKTVLDPTCVPLEVVPCDTFITESTFGLPIYRFPDSEKVAGEILQWWEVCRSNGKIATLFAYSLGKAQRILKTLSLLGAFPAPIYTHPAVEAINELYRQEGVNLPDTRLLTSEHKAQTLRQEGALIIAPPGLAENSFGRRFEGESAFLSGWMQVRGIRRRRALDRGFIVSDHADFQGLIKTVEGTGARRVLVTHGSAQALVRYLQERGLQAFDLKDLYSHHEQYAGEE